MKKILIYSLMFLLCDPVFGAEIVLYVDTGSAGGDGTTAGLSGGTAAYATLAAWEAAEAQDLTDAGGDFMTVHCNRTGGGGIDTTVVDIDAGWTTAAANYIEIIADDFPADGIWDASAYIIHNDDSATQIIRPITGFVRLKNLQIQVTETSTNVRLGVYYNGNTNPSDYRIDGCIVKGVCSGTAITEGIRYNGTNITSKIFNTVIYDFVSGADSDFAGIGTASATNVQVYNTNIYNCYTGYKEGTVTSVLKNCTIGNCTDDFSGGDTIDYCVSDDGDGTNSLDAVSGDWDNEFVDANNGDFTPVSGGNILVAGLNDPGSGLFSTDIIGDSYVTDSWSRNAYAGAPSSGISTGFMMISKDFWRTFLLEGIKGRWKIAS